MLGPTHEAKTATAPLVPHERLVASARKQPPQDEDDDDDLPMLESDRASCGTTGQEPSELWSTANEPVDRHEPDGEVHVWVYEARQLVAPSTLIDAACDRYRLCVQCTLFGAMQQSSCNWAGDTRNPVWRHAPNATRDGKCGHFVWTVRRPEKAIGKTVRVDGDGSHRELRIDITCRNCIVTSTSVPLDELLVASRRSASGVSRLGSHWVPLAHNTGLVNLSLEVASRRATCGRDLVRQRTGTLGAHGAITTEEPHLCTDVVVHRTVPLSTSRAPTRPSPPHCSSDITSAKARGVTLYIPTNETETSGARSKSAKTPPRASNASTATANERLEKQLRDLYHFGISNKVSESRDSDTMSVTSDFSTLSCTDVNASVYSHQASACASDVLRYNELTQDVDSVPTCTNDSLARSRARTTHDHRPHDSTCHVKPRRSNRRALHLTKPFDRIHSLWQGARRVASNASNSSTEDHSRRTRDKSGRSSTMTSPVPPVPVNEPGVVLYAPQDVPVEGPLHPSTSQDHVQKVAPNATHGTAGESRRQSIPVNTFSLEYRQEMRMQHQRKRAQRQQLEAQLLKSSLRAKADPLRSNHGRRESIHSVPNVRLSKAGHVHDAHVTTPATFATNYVAPKVPTTRTSARHRDVRSNGVCRNGAPLCVGKRINVGNVPGVVRYIGTTRFATGTWVGIELLEHKGKHNGTVDGHKYFSCAPDHGIFICASRMERSVP